MTEPLLLLPGMMCDARLFAHQIARLSKDRCVMIGPTTMGQSTAEIARFILRGAPETFALAGHGLGGMVAMEILKAAPDRVSRIALIDTSPLAESPNMAADREPLIIAARLGRLEEVLEGEMKPDYLSPAVNRDQVLGIYRTMGMDLGSDVFVRQTRALQRRPDQQKTLRMARLPALALCGADDTLCPIHRHEVMAALMPHGTLKAVPDAGHLLPLEQPEATTQALGDWLEAPLMLH
ncbi:MAG: alpha/beta hydrolase [Pseudoruegeria sp.]